MWIRPATRSCRILKQRGLLEDTLVVFGGEFGRTIYSQGRLTPTDYGRDHHPRCFSLWMAGGGFKPGITHGETDEFSYNIVRTPSTSVISRRPFCTCSGSTTIGSRTSIRVSTRS